MCGRYVEDVRDSEFILNFHQIMFEFMDAMDEESRFNIAPTTTARICRWDQNQQREYAPCRWGLVPSWSKSIGKPLINARSETADQKNSFRNSFKRRRCLVFATGYYEWQSSPSGKQPYFIHHPDHHPMLFYGLWERWRGPREKPLDTPLESYTILTTDAAPDLASIHDRMPCVVDLDSDFESWLNPEFQDLDQLRSRLTPSAGLVATRVSTFVNNVRNQGVQCIEPDA